MNKKNLKLLLVSDLVGYGKVSLSAQIPILSAYGYECYNLPTAIISNTLDYGKFEILDTTDYMKKTIDVWDELGFEFDAMSIGYIENKKQIHLIEDLIKRLSKKRKMKYIIHDPIMGDDGMLYNGIDDGTICIMRDMCKMADIITPNFTEACFIADIFFENNNVGRKELVKLSSKLNEISSSVCIITSAPLGQNKAVVINDGQNVEIIEYEEIDTHFSGTGDFFMAVLFANLLMDKDIIDSTKKAMHIVTDLIKKCKNQVDHFKGIPVELYLKQIDKL